jgi:hypothetical protein
VWFRDAAEAILKHELPKELPYFNAHADAEQKAMAEAYSDGRDAGVAEIKAAPPNYPPAQLLYPAQVVSRVQHLVDGFNMKHLPCQALGLLLVLWDLAA